MLPVRDPILSTGFFDQFRDSRVVDMTESWEQMMFNLKIQTTQQPSLQLTVKRKIHRGLDLMNRLRVRNS